MRRVLALVLSLVVGSALFAGCTKKEETKLKDDAARVKDEVTDSLDGERTPDGDLPAPAAEAPGESRGGAATPGNTLTQGTRLEDIVKQIGEELGVVMPDKVDDAKLKEVFGVNPEDVEEYYGEYSAVNTSADNIVAVKVKSGKMDQVKKALETRRDTVIDNFRDMLPEQLEKAEAGKVIEKGDYLFLVIAGDITLDAAQEMQRAQQVIDRYFQA